MYTYKRSGAVDTIGGALPLTSENQTAFLNTVQACFSNGQPRIVFDLGNIPLMDSVGLETLLDVRDQCQKRGGVMVLAKPNALCRDILRINGIDNELSIYEDTVTAMGSFAR